MILSKKSLKLNPVVRVLVFILLLFFLCYLLTFSPFLYSNVVENLNLTWQTVLREYLLIIPALLLFYSLYKVIYRQSTREHVLYHEESLFVPAMFSMFITGLSLGLHAVAESVEDVIENYNLPALYGYVYFINEFLGHFFFVSATILAYCLVIMEMNRKPTHLSLLDNILLVTIGFLGGLILGMGFIEGGSFYLLIVPLTLYLGIVLINQSRKHPIAIKNLPFTKCFFIAQGSMIAFSVYHAIFYGLFTQMTK